MKEIYKTKRESLNIKILHNFLQKCFSVFQILKKMTALKNFTYHFKSDITSDLFQYLQMYEEHHECTKVYQESRVITSIHV